MRPQTLSYLRAWGRATRHALLSLRRSPEAAVHAVFAPSCLAHAANLRFSSAPVVRGVRVIDAMHAWYFGSNTDSTSRFVLDDCGDLPCSNASSSAQHCPTLSSVRICSGRCKLQRRQRRIRIGLNPTVRGRNVCDISMELSSAADERTWARAGQGGASGERDQPGQQVRQRHEQHQPRRRNAERRRQRRPGKGHWHA